MHRLRTTRSGGLCPRKNPTAACATSPKMRDGTRAAASPGAVTVLHVTASSVSTAAWSTAVASSMEGQGMPHARTKNRGATCGASKLRAPAASASRCGTVCWSTRSGSRRFGSQWCRAHGSPQQWSWFSPRASSLGLCSLRMGSGGCDGLDGATTARRTLTPRSRTTPVMVPIGVRSAASAVCAATESFAASTRTTACPQKDGV
mmetsp:Transcript_10930/g.28888  ORF Transcript_10930/g.28888 Transcript_10930/m.28888 type:complete len:204 (+) Transcript_10930:260-871(+)